MAVQVNNPGKTIQAATTIAQRRLVKYDGNYCALDTSRDWVGVTQEPRTVGQYLPVRFTNAGSCVMTASAAVSAGEVVYKAADGKVSIGATGSVRVGIALESASGDGIEFEVLPD
jgi:uncharacterized protein DUF2190